MPPLLLVIARLEGSVGAPLMSRAIQWSSPMRWSRGLLAAGLGDHCLRCCRCYRCRRRAIGTRCAYSCGDYVAVATSRQFRRGLAIRFGRL